MGQPKPKGVAGTVVHMPDRRPLTMKQERFARAYVETGNASEAYRRSYDAEDMQPKVIWVEASRAFADPKVTLRISEIEAEALAATKLTIGRLAEEGFTLLSAARNEGDIRAATGALALLCRLHERLTSAGEVSNSRSIDMCATEELEKEVLRRRRPDENRARVAELLNRLGLERGVAGENEFVSLSMANRKPGKLPGL